MTLKYHNVYTLWVPNKYVHSSENYSANNTYIFETNRYQELWKNDDIQNECNTGDYVNPTKAVESNRNNRDSSDTRKESTYPITHRQKSNGM